MPENLLYPGAVIEQIAIQNKGLSASFRRDFSVGKNVFVYSVAADLQQQVDITNRGYLVQLGNLGQFQMLPIERRITFETIYAYGFSGVGSAQDTGKQPFADALACPSDMVRITGVNEIRAGAGTVIAIKYPYSRANYEAAAKVLDQGYFKLRHPTVQSFVMEITVAISPIELQKMLNVKLPQRRGRRQLGRRRRGGGDRPAHRSAPAA